MSVSPLVGPVENHREREKGFLVYPVYSRRSGGLSMGINLFPDRKRCSFDCPYCEVFPFLAKPEFSAERMEIELRDTLAEAAVRGLPVRDICFSGNGEPSLSPYLAAALRRAGNVREEMVPGAELVLITNGTGLLQKAVFDLLQDAACSLPLNIWLKLDAGTPLWYQQMNRSAVPFEELTAKIKEFAACTPVIIQTMLCSVDGKAPPPEEGQAWESLLAELAARAKNGKAGVRKVQIYSKARPAPEDPKAQAFPLTYLESRAASLRLALAGVSAPVPVEVYQ
ncbi:MAG: hypothetical protein LBD47_08820 [Treponema sp.]|jgi:histidinol dehydrogenase|nr:hypothetical protein [Treponema sp.]